MRLFLFLFASLFAINSHASIIKIKSPAYPLDQLYNWNLDPGDYQNVCLIYDKYDPAFGGVFRVNLDKSSQGEIILKVIGNDHSNCQNLILHPGEAMTCQVGLDHSTEICVNWYSPSRSKVAGTLFSRFVNLK